MFFFYVCAHHTTKKKKKKKRGSATNFSFFGSAGRWRWYVWLHNYPSSCFMQKWNGKNEGGEGFCSIYILLLTRALTREVTLANHHFWNVQITLQGFLTDFTLIDERAEPSWNLILSSTRGTALGKWSTSYWRGWAALVNHRCRFNEGFGPREINEGPYPLLKPSIFFHSSNLTVINKGSRFLFNPSR